MIHSMMKEADVTSLKNGILSRLGLPDDLGKVGRSVDGAPPSSVLSILEEAKDASIDVGAVADATVTSRVLQAVRSSTASTYASHWRGLCRFAEAFNFDLCNPNVQDIRRVIVCINCASTQRGWLAAWRLGLLLLGRQWPADKDPIIRSILAGTMRSQSVRAPKRRLRGKLLIGLLKEATRESNWPWAAAAVLTYFFMLRMPSEFFRQFKLALLKQVTN